MITVSLRPKLSPIYPNIIAPNGRSIKTEEKLRAPIRRAVRGSVFGKNNSFKRKKHFLI